MPAHPHVCARVWRYDATILTEVPEALRALHANELDRLSYIKHCIGHMITGFHSVVCRHRHRMPLACC